MKTTIYIIKIDGGKNAYITDSGRFSTEIGRFTKSIAGIDAWLRNRKYIKVTVNNFKEKH